MCRRQGLKLKATDYVILTAFISACVELSVVTVMDALEMKGEKEADKPLEKMVPILALSDYDVVLYKKVFPYP